MHQRQTGFTIVELLIVIVVIGVLATITVVAYNGVQNRANDVAVQADLRKIGSKIVEFKINNDTIPVAGMADFGDMGLRVSKSAYGAHYVPSSTGYNLIYCRNSTSNPSTEFVLVAASKSGNVYAYRDGGVGPGVGPLVTFVTTCKNNGLESSGSWFYASDTWQPWIK